jgi:hypothetical protein
MMDELIAATAASVDRQLAALAVELSGGPQAAAELLRSIAREQPSPMASDFLMEAGALLRARHLLATALQA